ncbi:MAG: hypothetical protein H7839_02275 [Magnetococcus sp. YQC-5]
MDALDEKFGILIDPQPLPERHRAFQTWERDFAPNSLSKLDNATADSLMWAMHEISSGWKLGKVLIYDTKIIWIIDRSGNLWFAIEELVLNGKPTGYPKHTKLLITVSQSKLGHPALINCAQARIAGEIYFDTNSDPPIWKINNLSGRYGRHNSRTPVHLDNVVTLFKGYGIDVTPHFQRNTV